ncbi:MAG: hypothetical protein EOM20_15675 [Spartobacteria bacterium]|nr:hypothetical protein [Spartobacteria bacterium]
MSLTANFETDWFADFRNPEGISESGATEATRATVGRTQGNPSLTDMPLDVAHEKSGQATQATTIGAGAHVAHVAQGKTERATNADTLETKENSGLRGSVAHVAHVAREFSIVEEFIDDIEERAAIMQYQAYDFYPDRQAALAAAYEDVKTRWLERIGK